MAADKEMDVLYFGEIHEKIRVLNLVIKPMLGAQELGTKSIQVFVKKDGIKVVKDDREQHTVPFEGM